MTGLCRSNRFGSLVSANMRHSRSILIFLCCVVPLLLQPSLTASQELDDENDFDYDPCSQLGPNNWGNLNAQWRACGTGKQQSPVNVDQSCAPPDPNLNALSTAYKRADAIMKNRGHDIMVEWPSGGGTLHIGSKPYELKQCHWHSPAEHTFNGIRYPLELHMVHQSNFDNETAVIGIMYGVGQPDTFITDKMMSKLSEFNSTGQNKSNLGITRPPRIPDSSPYYRYLGSLTTPPCTEGVIWTLMKQTRTVSREQLDLLRDAVHGNDNARPIQPLNGRIVSLYQRPRKEFSSELSTQINFSGGIDPSS
ncbi:alpha carbonic anhydrase 7-like [Iris pallida]|uniref:Alpha carbonic anhydrase 7-like n=1 Tax=Iris pallida TaxID=29817 RepID=A0AAX6HCE4_IRIPA|nr:alpha carbonic anhydrase 7-like [Iris pallida]